MYEKVNPSHPDKVADRIAGAIVDLAYKKSDRPRIAVEVQLGHGKCTIVVETSEHITREEVKAIVFRIADAPMDVMFFVTRQDIELSKNQLGKMRCGDNGIFRGMPITEEQRELTQIAHTIYDTCKSDGKYIIDRKSDRLIICQSNCENDVLHKAYPRAKINPLGAWTGGTNVDTGAVNRKLGSDMGDAVTGGGLHGKDLSKADVSVNIWAHLEAQRTGKPVEVCCAIGDEKVNGIPYADIVRVAHDYIDKIGGFEKFAEWGLI